MKTMALGLALIFTAGIAYSNEEFSSALRDELKDEVDTLYPKLRLKRKKGYRVAQAEAEKREQAKLEIKAQNDDVKKAEADADADATNSNESVQGITINNTTTTSTSSNSNPVNRPATVVEANPLNESRLERIKKDREAIERRNEEKLVERIEKDRLQRERTRSDEAEKLFNKEDKKSQTEAAAPVQPTVVVVPQAQPVAPVNDYNTPDITADVEEAIEEKPEEKKMRYYFSGLGGVGSYSAENVKGIWSAGAAFGVEFPEKISVEGAISFSSYDVESYFNTFTPCFGCPNTVQMDQQNYTLAVKYNFLDGRVKPHVGGLFGYTRREFSYRYFPNYNLPSSNAFDAGLLAGADIMLSENFSVGADFRYYFNVSYRREGFAPQPQFGFGFTPVELTPVEELSYYSFLVRAAFWF